MAFRPFFARVVVRAETISDKLTKLTALKKAGFQFPEQVKERDLPCWGEVLAVGLTADATIQIGMRVLFGKYAGHKLEGTEDLWVLQDQDIIGVDEVGLATEGVKVVAHAGSAISFQGPFESLSELHNVTFDQKGSPRKEATK